MLSRPPRNLWCFTVRLALNYLVIGYLLQRIKPHFVRLIQANCAILDPPKWGFKNKRCLQYRRLTCCHTTRL